MNQKYIPTQISKKTEFVDESIEVITQDPILIVSKLNSLKPVIVVKNNKNQVKVKGKGYIIIQESEVLVGLEHFYRQGSVLMRMANYSDSLMSFKQADMILSSAMMHDIFIDWKLLISIKLNLGISFYKVGFLEESFNYMENVLFHLKKKKHFIKDEHQFFKKRLVVQCYLQCCILLSELGKHGEAVDYSKMALKKIIQLIVKMAEYFYNNVIRLEDQQSKQNLQILYEVIYKFESLTAPILKPSCLKKIQILYINIKKLQLEQVDLGPLFKRIDMLFIANSNILYFLQIKALFMDDSQDFFNEKEVDEIGLIQKLGLLTVSYYCISTEGRFIEKRLKVDGDCENYLSHALEIAFLFLPHEMPLVRQIISVHSKFHALSKQVILEGRDGQPVCVPDEFELILLKQFKGQPRGNFFIPLIRKYKNQRYFSQPKKNDVNEIQQKIQDQIFEVLGPRTTTSSQKKNQAGNQAKFDLSMQQNTSERTKSAGRKTYTQQTSPLNNDQRPQLRDIFTSKASTQKRTSDNQKLPNQTVVIANQTEINEIVSSIQRSRRKTTSVVTQRVNQNQSQNQQQFFSSNNSPQQQDRIQQNFFDRPNIQIFNNYNTQIKINDSSRTTPHKAKQLDQLDFQSEGRPRQFVDLQTTKIKQPRMFIARKRTASQKQS